METIVNFGHYLSPNAEPALRRLVGPFRIVDVRC
jgi:hypothetical protein